MITWILKCPNCGTENEVVPESVVVKCGVAHCHCKCRNCQNEFEGQQDYLRWLGLSEAELEEIE
jgi:hypothetical protein